ncbi:DUF2062 domain-containing protein [Marinobacterium rhizophilum]|uniref:DUF2062 domain-containing protein n=1 Tax=Marinobacterium rhizophilum TaxID=420402 RepID=UPI000371D2A3|nr:DUF2062 domain-containing protein [Marinobacterium rhizophilum]
MPRKLIKKYMPNEHRFRTHRSLSWLGDHIHDPNLFHLTRKSVSRAAMVGIFCAFMPIPLQMLAAAIIAVVARSNLPISVGLVWLTNPLTMPPVFYFTYLIGSQILGAPVKHVAFEFSLQTLGAEISAVWWPLLLGSVICGVVFSLLGYAAVQLFWIYHVNSSWKKRRQARKNRK